MSSLTTSGLAPAPPAPAETLINLNTASRAELERLPGIGAGLAARIVEHRERHGAFRRVEHLIIVRGISERRFAALRAFVTVD
ncbi:MAG TPA: helix-hairpin-helix domain-containing protein [Pyrinomonadaceae bacterium]